MAMHVYAIIVAMIPLIDAIQNSSYHDCDVWQAWFVDDAFNCCCQDILKWPWAA